MAITNEQQTEILKIVTGLFNAAPGGTYLTELANLVDGGMTTAQLADALAAHSLFTGTVLAGKVTVSAQVAVLMKNFGLTADSDPASAGSQAEAYFTQRIEAGDGFGGIVYDAVQFLSGSVPPEFTEAATLLSNKALVAEAYSLENSSTSLTDLQKVVSAVTGTAAYTDDEVQAILDGLGTTTGETFKLTTGADNFVGGSGDDFFDGSLSSTNITFGAGDQLNGGTGDDTLSIITNAAGTYSAGSIQNVENIDLTASSGATTLSLVGVTGVDQVTSRGTTEDVTISGLGSLDTVIAVSNPGADDSTTVVFTAATVSGSSDTATVKLSGIAHTTTNDTDDINIQDVETINIITASSASTVDAFDTDATKFVITGDQNLTIGESLEASNGSLLTVDASGLTGGLTFTANATTAMTVTGGSGNDSFTMTGGSAVNDTIDAGAGNDTVTFSANLATTDTVIGGDGTDTLQLTSALATGYTAPSTATITGFETLKLSNALAGALTVANVQSGITTVDLNAGSGAFTLTLEAGAQNVKIGATNTGAFVIADTGTATTDSVTVTNTGAASDMFNGNDLTITGFETLNLVGTGTGAATPQDIGALAMTADTGGSTTVNFSGSNTFTATSINALTISASGLTGSAVLTMGGATTGKAQTITGGANSDTLLGASDTAGVIDGGAGNDTVTGGSGNDSLTGGDGNDSITAGAGNDTVNGGAGNDTIVMAGNFTTGDVIDGGDGTDALSITTAGASTIAGLSISAITNLNAALSNVEAVSISDQFNVGAAFDMARLDSVANITLVDGINGNEELSGLAANTTVTVNADNAADTDILTLTLGDSSGTSDTLNYSIVQAATDDYGVLAISGVETLNVSVTEATADATVRVATLGLNITTASSGTTVNFSGTETITIDTVIAAQTINSTTTGAFIMTNATGSGLNQTITTGDGADSIYGGGGVDTINAGAGDDSIVGGSGADVITGGTGADTIVGGSGNDNITLTESTASVDDVVVDYSEAGASIDTITGFTTTSSGDEIQLDLSALEAAGTSGIHASASNFVEYDADQTSDGVAAAAASVQVLTGAGALTDEANVFVLSGATFADKGEVEDALEVGGSFAIAVTAGDDMFDTAGNAFIVVWTNGTDSYVTAMRANTVTTAGDTDIEAGDLGSVNLVTITGVSSISSTTFASANFEWIA